MAPSPDEHPDVIIPDVEQRLQAQAAAVLHQIHLKTRAIIRDGWFVLTAGNDLRGKRRDLAGIHYLHGVCIGLTGASETEKRAAIGLLNVCALVGAEALDAIET